LGFYSKNEIYQRAFVHKSVNQKTNNERLEFLGDAILSFVISDLLFLENKEEEGFLSKKRATIVGRKHLNVIAKNMIPESEIKKNLKRTPDNIYGNTLEALIGAIYLDQGINFTRSFIKKHIYQSEFIQTLQDIDYKSKLLTLSQKEKIKITYRVESQIGPDHNKEFSIAILANEKKVAEAKGKSKKEAEQNAAKKAIKIVF
tara:strand:+ start:88488 stop:89093 length:606 start_codon:yes stop_codon:yes gene_type:complete